MEELFVEWWDSPDTIRIFTKKLKNGNRIIYFFTKDFETFRFDQNKSKTSQILEVIAQGMNMPWTGEVNEGFIENVLDRFDADCRYVYSGLSIVYDSISFELYGYGDTEEEAIKDYKEKLEWLNTFLSDDFYDEQLPEIYCPSELLYK